MNDGQPGLSHVHFNGSIEIGTDPLAKIFRDVRRDQRGIAQDCPPEAGK